MTDLTWGLLGPESISNERRTRTLGLSSAVRKFNDLAVPGMGGVWFAKQLLLPVLGISIAERLRRDGTNIQNIQVANAVEALSCWLSLNKNGWRSEPRLRGATKMRERSQSDFATVRKSSFYVSTPMRASAVQPLPSLGLIEARGERFNAFHLFRHQLRFFDRSWH